MLEDQPSSSWSWGLGSLTPAAARRPVIHLQAEQGRPSLVVFCNFCKPCWICTSAASTRKAVPILGADVFTTPLAVIFPRTIPDFHPAPRLHFQHHHQCRCNADATVAPHPTHIITNFLQTLNLTSRADGHSQAIQRPFASPMPPNAGPVQALSTCYAATLALIWRCAAAPSAKAPVCWRLHSTCWSRRTS